MQGGKAFAAAKEAEKGIALPERELCVAVAAAAARELSVPLVAVRARGTKWPGAVAGLVAREGRRAGAEELAPAEVPVEVRSSAAALAAPAQLPAQLQHGFPQLIRGAP